MQVQGARICPDCGGVVDDPDNFRATSESTKAGITAIVVRHITCPLTGRLKR